MTREEIADKLGEILCEHFDTPAEKLMEYSHINDFGGDSLDKIEIMMEIEEVFNIDIEYEDQEELEKMSSIIDLIMKKLKKL